jgi:hypothetical protein
MYKRVGRAQESNAMHVQVDEKVSIHLRITIQKNKQKYSILNRIHSKCGPCYTEHGLREHSTACQ